ELGVLLLQLEVVLSGGDAVVVRTSDSGPPRAEGEELRARRRKTARALQDPGPVREPPALQDRGAGADRGDDGRRRAGHLGRGADAGYVADGGSRSPDRRGAVEP